MPRLATLPFILRHRKESFTAVSMTTTTETVHGLLRLEGEELTVQWRRGRKIQDLGGTSMSSDEEFEAVREATIPLSAMSGAIVQRPWWRLWSPRIVLFASDLRALDACNKPNARNGRSRVTPGVSFGTSIIENCW